jgi:hypothetical protein
VKPIVCVGTKTASFFLHCHISLLIPVSPILGG